MKYIATSLLYIFIFFNLVGCENRPSNFESKVNINAPDSSDLGYIYHKAQVRELNLPNLEMGSDSFEIRIWKDTHPYNLHEIIIIKQETKKNWIEGYYYRYWLTEVLGDNPESATRIDSVHILKVSPKSGWEKLLTNISAAKFYELPSQDKLPGFKAPGLCGVSWQIEISTSAKYKFIAYEMPEWYIDKYWQCKQMVLIGEMINAEFPLIPPVNIDSLINVKIAKDKNIGALDQRNKQSKH